MLLGILLFLLLIVASFTDIRSHKIYNWSTFPAIILGLGFNMSLFGWLGLRESLIGLGVGFALLFIFYLGGMIGGGDVKLLAAVGALKGPSFVLWGGLYGAAIGGVIALFSLIWRRRLRWGLKRVFHLLLGFFIPYLKPLPLERKGSPLLPYGLFIALGILSRWLELKFYG